MVQLLNGKNGVHPKISGSKSLADIDPSKLIVKLTATLAELPRLETLVFGGAMTDHMLIVNFDPLTGWSEPVIQPYSNLSLSPASSCFHYAPSLFEGMKAFRGPDGKPRLFRPELNMKRMARSAERVALPSFNTEAVLTLIKKLVMIDQRWIPSEPGYSLYIRPTLIGTRPALGVVPSSHACLFVILSPTGPYFPSPVNSAVQIFNPISLLATYDYTRSWPGGTGEFKLALNYGACFMPQKLAAQQGYQQILWLLEETNQPEHENGHSGDGVLIRPKKHMKITEAGQMNFFAVFKMSNGDLELATPPLDGTILPGITRDSVLALGRMHRQTGVLRHLPSTVTLHVSERVITMTELLNASASGSLLEAFGAGTAAIICPIGRIGFEGDDLELPKYEREGGLGIVGRAVYEALDERMVGRVPSDWSVPCE